jgi:hypothetical protein
MHTGYDYRTYLKSFPVSEKITRLIGFNLKP